MRQSYNHETCRTAFPDAGVCTHLIPILPVKTVYNPTKLVRHMEDRSRPMRRLQLEWKESEEDLKRLYLNEHDRHKRMRLQALWLLRKGQYIHDVAAAIGCHPRTVQDWVAWYRNGGLADVLRHRKGGRGHVCRLSDVQIAGLKQQAAAGQFQRVQDAVEWVKARYQVAYT